MVDFNSIEEYQELLSKIGILNVESLQMQIITH